MKKKTKNKLAKKSKDDLMTRIKEDQERARKKLDDEIKRYNEDSILRMNFLLGTESENSEIRPSVKSAEPIPAYYVTCHHCLLRIYADTLQSIIEEFTKLGWKIHLTWS